jgi:hypothetical protein
MTLDQAACDSLHSSAKRRARTKSEAGHSGKMEGEAIKGLDRHAGSQPTKLPAERLKMNTLNTLVVTTFPMLSEEGSVDFGSLSATLLMLSAVGFTVAYMVAVLHPLHIL